MGQLQHGEYEREFDDVHPDILDRYYGTHGRPLRRNHSGAGSTGEDYESVGNQISADQEGNIHNESVETPPTHCPLDEQSAHLFRQMLDDELIQNSIPHDFGLREDEWDDGYPPTERIKMRGGKHVDIDLPFTVWWPRAIKWVRALKLLTLLQLEQGQ